MKSVGERWKREENEGVKRDVRTSALHRPRI